MPRNVVLAGDARERLSELPPSSVDCAVTSPPYFGLRDYGNAKGEIGHEPSVDGYVEGLLAVCHEIARVLKPAGSFWLNLRDVYSRTPGAGAPPKSLLLGPDRLLFALMREGWLVRNRIVWAKRNSVPESVRDRLSVTHEDLFLLTRQPSYISSISTPSECRTPVDPSDGDRRAHRQRSAPTRQVTGAFCRCRQPDESGISTARTLAPSGSSRPRPTEARTSQPSRAPDRASDPCQLPRAPVRRVRGAWRGSYQRRDETLVRELHIGRPANAKLRLSRRRPRPVLRQRHGRRRR